MRVVQPIEVVQVRVEWLIFDKNKSFYRKKTSLVKVLVHAVAVLLQIDQVAPEFPEVVHVSYPKNLKKIRQVTIQYEKLQAQNRAVVPDQVRVPFRDPDRDREVVPVHQLEVGAVAVLDLVVDRIKVGSLLLLLLFGR